MSFPYKKGLSTPVALAKLEQIILAIEQIINKFSQVSKKPSP